MSDQPKIRKRTRPVANNETAAPAQASTGAGYVVGYCRPPEEHRFKKGVVNNPNGRPRKHTDLLSEVIAALGEKVPVKKKGRVKYVPATRALAELSKQAALTGDTKPLMLVARLARLLEQAVPKTPPAAVVAAPVIELDEDDIDVLNFFAERARAMSDARDSHE